MNETCFSIWSCSSLSFLEELAMLAVSKMPGLASAHPRQDRPALVSVCCALSYG